MKKESYTIDQHEHLKFELKTFLKSLNKLINSNVEVFNDHYDKREQLVSVDPESLSYSLSEHGHNCLKDKYWDEVDYMRFRHSFKLKDCFTV